MSNIFSDYESPTNWWGLVVIAAVVCVVFIVGVKVGNDAVFELAVKHGVAEHNPQTGKIQWKEAKP